MNLLHILIQSSVLSLLKSSNGETKEHCHHRHQSNPPLNAFTLFSFILHAKKTAFIVEHDFIMATYLADRVIVYTGTPAKDCCATSYGCFYSSRIDTAVMTITISIAIAITIANNLCLYSPQSLLSGMNQFLKDLNITFRRDPTNFRPRINKLNSVKDTEQKASGTYFYMGDDDDDDVVSSRRKK